MTGETTSERPAAARFRAARDFLLDHRKDYDTAYREFAWPELTECRESCLPIPGRWAPVSS